MTADSRVDGVQILGSDVKESNSEEAVEVVDPALVEQLSELALAVFEELGARDYGRIDIRMDSDGVPQFLEANLTPGLVEESDNLQKAREQASGISYQQMLVEIVDLALNRPASDELVEPKEAAVEVPVTA